MFDMLFRDDLSAKEIDCIKKIASELLIKIKTTIATMDHWTEKRETQAAVDTLIRNTLLAQLPDCYDYDEIQLHKQQIYEHVYVRYGNAA